jgi:hypothetical protein
MYNIAVKHFIKYSTNHNISMDTSSELRVENALQTFLDYHRVCRLLFSDEAISLRYIKQLAEIFHPSYPHHPREAALATILHNKGSVDRLKN